MTEKLYHKNNTYGELKTAVLGSYYTSDYFKFITNSCVREPLMRVADEINEDLETFENILRRHGTTVLRPKLPSVSEFVEYFDHTGKFLMPSIAPRDGYAVIGNRMYKVSPDQDVDKFVNSCLIEYNQEHFVDLSSHNVEFFHSSLDQATGCYNKNLDTWYCRNKYNELAGPDWPAFEDYVQGIRSNHPYIKKELENFENALQYEKKEVYWLQGPNIMPMDDHIVIDCNEYCNYAEWVRRHMDIGTRTVDQITTKASHTDGCFVILGKQTIIGIDPLIDYDKYFPNHKVIAVPAESYQNQLSNFNIMKTRVDGRWWVPGEEHNEDFINYVELYLRDWTGHVYETVFDVNVLVLNPETVCVSNYNKDIFSRLQQQGIEPLIVPWRHRFFVDCGLHCLTLDLQRG